MEFSGTSCVEAPSGDGENKVFKGDISEYVPPSKAFNGSPLPAGERPCSLISHSMPFMICSLLSFRVLSVASLPPTATRPHTHSLSANTCSSPNTTSWVTLSYLCTCSCLCLVPEFFPFLLGDFLGFFKSMPLYCTQPGDTI